MSRRTFNEGLYHEHLEEIASLAQMRALWLSDEESAPDDVAGLESRIEAHVDALCLGGSDALDAAHRAARPDDPWSLYAWVAVACRADGLGQLRDTLTALETFLALDGDDVDPTTLREAVADALIHHLPQPRVDFLAQQLHQVSPHVVPVLLRCISTRAQSRAQSRAQLTPAASRSARHCRGRTVR